MVQETEILFVDGDMAVSWLGGLEGQEELGDGGFTGAGRADEEGEFVCWEEEGEGVEGWVGNGVV